MDGVWNFALAQSVNIDTEKAWERTIPPTLQVPVPASYNDIFVDSNIRNHVGWAYNQRRFNVPPSWTQHRYFWRFDAATHKGRVYINDQFVTEHIGGYTPFDVDLTGIVKPGQQVRLTVAVNNELDWHKFHQEELKRSVMESESNTTNTTSSTQLVHGNQALHTFTSSMKRLFSAMRQCWTHTNWPLAYVQLRFLETNFLSTENHSILLALANMKIHLSVAKVMTSPI